LGFALGVRFLGFLGKNLPSNPLSSSIMQEEHCHRQTIAWISK
jgi:hypothetical protein